MAEVTCGTSSDPLTVIVLTTAEADSLARLLRTNLPPPLEELAEALD